ncbi:SWIM zinc finger family protein [Streptomyces sp. NPDC001292]|uniref:SWIM zinc finger family protein n=1 Tax=Streptomyces sp. NPDC001292 TaxID=3364558 RepID=UPI00369D9D27
MDERPADAARRALRAAREQQTRTPDGSADHRKPAPEDPAGAGNRPGDAARDALRRAVSARRGDAAADGGDASMTAEDTDESAPRPPVPSGDPADAAAPRRPTGPRPSDAAREALRGALARRAARAERSRADAAQAGTRAARPPTPAPGGATRPTPAGTAAGDGDTDTHDTAPATTDAPTGPVRTHRAASGHDTAPGANGATDQESPEPRTVPPTPASSEEDLSTASVPAAISTAAWAAASHGALARTPEDVPAGVLAATPAVASGTPSDGSPDRTSQDRSPVASCADASPTPSGGSPNSMPQEGAPVASSTEASCPSREGSPNPTPQPGPRVVTPDAPSAARGEGVPVGTPDAPSARTPPDGASEDGRAYGRRASPSPAGVGAGSAAFPLAQAGAEPPGPPRMPRSMASPRRDGELRRTFPAFPARAVEGDRFAETWWGNAWIDALEEGALDAARLARGRGYAQTGHVDAVTVTPGLVLAYVQGSRPRPYRVQVRLRTLDDADWDRFLDAVAERPGHIAALLDKEMPQALADCGVPLLPGPGDLEPHCSCPDRGHPCKHAAALCYQTARLLDADPFVLLLLRGRGERELLDALSRLSATRTARAAQEREPDPFPGVRAAHALAERRLPPLPAPLPAPPHPEQPPVYPAAPGGPDPFALDQLATDAAARAHALLTTGRDPIGGLTLWQDAVRLAAARPGSGLTAATRSLYASLASATGRTTAELARAVAAWRQGGPEGLAVLEEPWDPPAGRFDRARPLLLAADLPAFRPWRNRLTHPRGHLQLRLGRDGLWYAYESEPDRDDWWPRGTPDLDPVGALTGLGAPGAL